MQAYGESREAGKAWTDGMQKNSEQGGRGGRAFLPDASQFPCPREAVSQQGAWVPADGSCDTGDGVFQVSGSKIKTSMNQKGENSHISQSVSVLNVPSCKSASWQADQGLWRCCDASLSGFNRSHHYILIIHLVKTAEKSEGEYQALLPSWLMAVAWRMRPWELQMLEGKAPAGFCCSNLNLSSLSLGAV